MKYKLKLFIILSTISGFSFASPNISSSNVTLQFNLHQPAISIIDHGVSKSVDPNLFIPKFTMSCVSENQKTTFQRNFSGNSTHQLSTIPILGDSKSATCTITTPLNIPSDRITVFKVISENNMLILGQPTSLRLTYNMAFVFRNTRIAYCTAHTDFATSLNRASNTITIDSSINDTTCHILRNCFDCDKPLR